MEDNKNVDVEEVEVTDSKTYTEDELLAMVQSEADRRVSEALKTQQRKYEQQLKKEKSLSNLDADARAKKELEIEIEELREQAKIYKLQDEKQEIIKVLSARGLDISLVDYIVTTLDNNENMQKIDNLDNIFKRMVKQEVEKRIGGSTPKTSTVGLDGGVTKEQFAKMSLAERTELFENNLQLYNQLEGK